MDGLDGLLDCFCCNLLCIFGSFLYYFVVTRPASRVLIGSIHRVIYDHCNALFTVAHLNDLELAVLWVSFELNNIAYLHFDSVVVGDVNNIAH